MCIRDRGEVAKYALLDANAFEFVNAHLINLVRLKDLHCMANLIADCCRIKARIVAEDERESGQRRLLNLGHTLGHALEAVTRYQFFRHGEAVVHGLDWAVSVSESEGLLSSKDAERIRTFLKRFQKPAIPEKIQIQDVVDAISHDKKQTQEGLHLILLRDIGRPAIKTVEQLDALTDAWLKKTNA
jgi:3-dehydroquinate synthase